MRNDQQRAMLRRAQTLADLWTQVAEGIRTYNFPESREFDTFVSVYNAYDNGRESHNELAEIFRLQGLMERQNRFEMQMKMIAHADTIVSLRDSSEAVPLGFELAQQLIDNESERITLICLKPFTGAGFGAARMARHIEIVHRIDDDVDGLVWEAQS